MTVQKVCTEILVFFSVLIFPGLIHKKKLLLSGNSLFIGMLWILEDLYILLDGMNFHLKNFPPEIIVVKIAAAAKSE